MKQCDICSCYAWIIAIGKIYIHIYGEIAWNWIMRRCG